MRKPIESQLRYVFAYLIGHQTVRRIVSGVYGACLRYFQCVFDLTHSKSGAFQVKFAGLRLLPSKDLQFYCQTLNYLCRIFLACQIFLTYLSDTVSSTWRKVGDYRTLRSQLSYFLDIIRICYFGIAPEVFERALSPLECTRRTVRAARDSSAIGTRIACARACQP